MFGLKGIEMEEKQKTKKREGEILGGGGGKYLRDACMWLFDFEKNEKRDPVSSFCLFTC